MGGGDGSSRVALSFFLNFKRLNLNRWLRSALVEYLKCMQIPGKKSSRYNNTRIVFVLSFLFLNTHGIDPAGIYDLHVGWLSPTLLRMMIR